MLSIVGIGPGAIDMLTERAKNRISNAEIIIGHRMYIELIREIIPPQAKVISTEMGSEIERAKMAIQLGKTGNVALISGGDPGIYGMAGIVIEIMKSSQIPLEIIPGITAASAAAALLGAPLANDFAVISLSDKLTPWEEIERKLEGLAKLDIVVVIYNPKSATRTMQLQKAYHIFLQHRRRDTLVGIVRNAERKDSEVIITTLDSLPNFYSRIDMSTTIIIGCSRTERIGSYLVTRRGYERKYKYELY